MRKLQNEEGCNGRKASRKRIESLIKKKATFVLPFVDLFKGFDGWCFLHEVSDEKGFAAPSMQLCFSSSLEDLLGSTKNGGVVFGFKWDYTPLKRV